MYKHAKISEFISFLSSPCTCPKDHENILRLTWKMKPGYFPLQGRKMKMQHVKWNPLQMRVLGTGKKRSGFSNTIKKINTKSTVQWCHNLSSISHIWFCEKDQMEQRCCINTNITLGELELFNLSNKSFCKRGAFRLRKKSQLLSFFGKHPGMFLFILYKCSLPPMPRRQKNILTSLVASDGREWI